MKRFILLMIFILIALSSCENIGLYESTKDTTKSNSLNNKEEIEPILHLIGEEQVLICLEETYTDQGVSIIGDYDLDIMSINDIDNTKLGLYTISYSITYNEENISISRFVKVVTKTEKDLDIHLNLISNKSDELTFAVRINKNLGVLSNLSAKLYSIDTVIEEIDIEDGINILRFDHLDENRVYSIKLSGSYFEENIKYDLNDYEITGKTTLSDTTKYPILKLKGVINNQIYLYTDYIEKGITFEGDFTTVTEKFSNINNKIEGEYIIIYKVTYNDQLFYIYRIVNVYGYDVSDFNLSLDLISKTPFSITYYLNANSKYDDVFLYKLIIRDNNNYVISTDYETGSRNIEVLNLDPSTEYEVVVVGKYYNNSVLKTINLFTTNIYTLENVEPLITFVSKQIILNSCTAKFLVTDLYNSLLIIKAKIYKDNILIATSDIDLADREITFIDLERGFNYRIDIYFVYKNGRISELENTITFCDAFLPLTALPTNESDSYIPFSNYINYIYYRQVLIDI